MSIKCEELSLSAQTAYAQLLDATLGADHARTVADLPGSFAAKTVRGHKYWYFQFTEPSGKLRQLFVGRDSPAAQALIAKKGAVSARQSLVPLARSAVALGLAGVLPKHFRVIRRLADYGFFKAGGMLIGTHAFVAYANMLGVRWGVSERTQDVDFAHPGKSISLALPGDVEVETREAIASLEMGFLPISGLGSRTGAGCLVPSEPGFRLDFLTPLHRGSEDPFVHEQLHVALQPLKFLEYLLESVEQAALFCAEGSVVVNVPQPARYALHKLLVHGERAGTFRTKAGKDLSQAAQLLACLKVHHAEEVESAWGDLINRGRAWKSRAAQGLVALATAYPRLRIEEWLRMPVQRVARRETRRRVSAA